MVAGSAPIATATSIRFGSSSRTHAAIMFRALLVGLPVHAGGALVEDLQPIAAAVALAGVRIARKHHGQRDEAPAVLAASTCRIGKSSSEKLSRRDHLLARPARNDLRKERAHLGQLRQHLQLADEALRACASRATPTMRPATSSTESTSSAISIRRMLAKALISTGTVDALGLFEQQRRAARLHAAVGEFGDLEVRIDFERDALQFPVLFSSARMNSRRSS